jgi:uncharacterized protein (DUF1501 family)/uncharacterized protein (DUF1800 family)
MNNIQRSSSNEDYYIIPVARSYNNKNWERVAGPYVQDLSISGCCELVIPNLSSQGKYLLMSFSHSATNKEEVSRFFQQTTFGPDLDMINSWNYSNDMMQEMGKWLKTQMDIDQTPMTSHRAYFRERANFVLEYESADRYRRPRHPCAQYSRWREYSFIAADYDFEFTVTRWNGQYLITIDGVPRTVMGVWKDEWSDQNLRLGSWQFCWYTEEKVNGVTRIYDENTDECYTIYNPKIYLPDSFLADKRTIVLPNKSNFNTIDPIIGQAGDRLFGGGLYAKNKLTTTGCSDITEDGNYDNIIGIFPNGDQVYYAAGVQLDNNTVENPIADGGNGMMNTNASKYEDWASEARCPVPFSSFLNIDSCYLSTTSANACSPSWTKGDTAIQSLVCGSPGEVSNNPLLAQNTFTFPYNNNFDSEYKQKSDVWNMIALRSDDQLRQRMAFALSQILVVTSKQINDDGYSEIYLNYYDIFVRNAFGNYFDILKEVSFSPMMAEMLSFLDSKSSAWVLEDSGARVYPDENYAREIMQLFSIGLYQLNIDGTKKVDNSGSPIFSYDNTDIQNFARAWTGFTRERNRANIESGWWDDTNRIDPLRVIGVHRDPFPKMDLHGGYIGDKTPLCVDLPSQHFLKKGATYRLLGSTPQPQFHDYGHYWHYWVDWFDPREEGVLVLDSASQLRTKLATKDIIVTLSTSLQCTGEECNIDSVNVVKIQSNPPLYYEYVRQPCVELSYYDNAQKITATWDKLKSMCANPKLESAYDSCCEYPSSDTLWAESLCKYNFERTTQSTSRDRCQSSNPNAQLCDFHYTWSSEPCFTSNLSWYMQDEFYWTNKDCALKAKVNEQGQIAIVHIPPLQTDYPYYETLSNTIDLRVHPDNSNYFKVSWDSTTYPKPSNSCGNGVCQSIYRACLCSVTVEESTVFTALPSLTNILQNLHIGSFDPALLGDAYTQVPNTGNIKVWHKNGIYDKDTIFRVTYRGKEIYLKNLRSTVKINNQNSYKFRNPPSFLNLAFRETRDALYETDAVLENYLYHDNVAPFLAMRLIQRFGISNPSPQYVETVATAFKEGSYPNPDSGSFGDGRYGNLESTVAAIVLNDEARSVVLDADPTFGSFVEPLLKLTRIMRALKFEPDVNSGERMRLLSTQQLIGQEAHNAPSVFNFFRPEYTASGHIKTAAVSSPEAQVLTGPKIIRMLNGFIALIDLGFNNCYGGLGEGLYWWCDGIESGYYDTDTKTYGELKYSPSTPDQPIAIVNELSMLLTGGRLNSSSKTLIADAFRGELDSNDGLRLAQKLVISTPEFHSSSVFDVTSTERPELPAPTPSNKRYKAVVFLYLDGGSDSHNMLVPYAGCSRGKTSYNQYAEVRGEIALSKNVLLPIDASGSNQVCSTFGLHPQFSHLKSLYDNGELLWVANMGVLQQYCNEDNWWEKTAETALFAHNIQYEETHNMDIYEQQAGRGIGGRMMDVLERNGFSPTSVSVNGVADFIVAFAAATFILDPWGGGDSFNPIPSAQPLWENLKKLNSGTNLGSSLFGETWANLLFTAVRENEMLTDTIASTSLSTSFDQDSELEKQLENVSKLIKTQKKRGADREVFYVQLGGFDTHDNIEEQLNTLTEAINDGLKSFTTEMKAQGAWDDVTVVMVSEFARTLPGNTGAGSDHAWGGNYFVAGGEVRGKRILGSYPDDLSDDSPFIFEPGIVIPDTPWDALWNGVAQWFGITTSDDLDEILPNRKTFGNKLFNQNDLYKTSSPTPAPAPSGQSSCEDSPFRFKVEINGKVRGRSCVWVATRGTLARCRLIGVKEMCSSTCSNCQSCSDSTLRFKFEFNGKKITRGCSWVANKNTFERCQVTGMKHACRATCGTC